MNHGLQIMMSFVQANLTIVHSCKPESIIHLSSLEDNRIRLIRLFTKIAEVYRAIEVGWSPFATPHLPTVYPRLDRGRIAEPPEYEVANDIQPNVFFHLLDS